MRFAPGSALTATHGRTTPVKAKIFDELCATTGWHRVMRASHCVVSCGHELLSSERRGHRKYGLKVIAALIFCWAVRNARRQAAGADAGRAGSGLAPP